MMGDFFLYVTNGNFEQVEIEFFKNLETKLYRFLSLPCHLFYYLGFSLSEYTPIHLSV